MYIFFENENNIMCESELIEQKMMGHRMPKAKIRTVLQTMDDVNKNKRIYPKTIIERGLKEIQPTIQNRSWLGELDHPVVTGNETADTLRHFTVLYEKVSHIIESVYTEGNKVMGIVETTTTDSGFKLAGLIMDKVPIGFSLRAVGESKSNPNGIIEITNPFSMITYDSVSNPSHSQARMVELVNDSITNESITSYVTENVGDIFSDRTHVLREMISIGSSINNLGLIIENIDKSLRNNNIFKADKLVDGLINLYLKENLSDTGIINFLDDYINGKAPLSDAFRKYITTI